MMATALVVVDTTLGEVDLVVVDLEVMVVVAAMAMTYMGVIVATDHPMMVVADLLMEVVVVEVAVVYLDHTHRLTQETDLNLPRQSSLSMPTLSTRMYQVSMRGTAV